jgi:translocation and assembly module TamA
MSTICRGCRHARFFAGGDRSVRGYRYQKLGPTDTTGAVAGGRYLLTANAEVDYLFFRNYGAAVFYDAGNAANEPSPAVKHGVGIGMRWRSPSACCESTSRTLDDPTRTIGCLSIGSDL